MKTAPKKIKLMSKAQYDKLCNEVEQAENDLGGIEAMLEEYTFDTGWPSSLRNALTKAHKEMKAFQRKRTADFDRLQAALEKEEDRRTEALTKFCERCGQPVTRRDS